VIEENRMRHPVRTADTRRGAPAHGSRPGRARRVLLPAAVLALLAPLAACGGDSGDGGDTSTIMLITEARSLDPAMSVLTAINDSQRLSAIYDLLMYVDQETGKVRPNIAESATASPDGRVWTLKIRPDVKFTDGTPYDAAAVKFNWDRFADPALRSAQASAVRGVTTAVADPLTLTITLAEPNQHFDQVIASRLTYVASPTAVRNLGADYGNKPVGAGPYRVKEWARDAQLTLEANPAYWQPGRPKLKTLVIKPVPDDGQRVGNVKSGAAQLAITANATTMTRAKDDGATVVRPRLNGGTMTMFNTTRAPFDDVRARRAVALALDPAESNRQVESGNADPASNLFAEGSPYHTPAGTIPTGDRERAQALFDQLAAEGKPLDFHYMTIPSPNGRRQAEWIQARLSTFKNVRITLDFVETSVYNQKFVSRDYQSAVYAVNFVDPEPVLYDFARSGNSANFTGWNNPLADAALDRGRTSTDPAVRVAAYQEVTRLMAEDVPFWLYQRSATALFGKGYTDLTLVNDGVILFDRYGVK
jgi:peptide/nickel transport system substrate-binding protein